MDDRDRLRRACWERFRAAADAWILRHDPEPSMAYLADVRARLGDEVAERQAKELRSYVHGQIAKAKRAGRRA